jgi:glycosyltransferase involved in cell wall biosynthesis
VAAITRRLRRQPGVKVSIIIAAYNSDPDRLDRLMTSLDAQSMPAQEFEVVFVDDGSTDDTRSRLDALAGVRSNVIVQTIPNSGWASRPRNVGIGLARGEYLLFMDHDDELFPRALERAYEFGRDHRADVVSAKEVRTAGWSWGWDAFTGDIPLAEQQNPNPLIPMTPHKLYRRRFVRKNGVLFPEGPRVFWEDQYFNVSMCRNGARVAILSSYLFYHWVSVEQSSSRTYSRDPEEYWSKLSHLLHFLESQLAELPGGRACIAHYLHGRAVSFVGPHLLELTSSDQVATYGHVQRLVDDHAPVDDDEALRSVNRCRVELVRSGRLDLQRRLAELDRGVTAIPVIESVAWEETELVLTITTTLVDGTGSPVRLRRDGDGWARVLPADLADVLSADAVDVTREGDAAFFRASVKGRTSRSTWPLEGHGTVTVNDDGTGHGVITGKVTARFDPVAFAAEHDLDDPVWDFAARFGFMGYVSHRALRGGRTLVALLDGQTAVGYENRDGLFSLDVAAEIRAITDSGPLSPVDALLEAHRGEDTVGVEAAIAMPDIHCVGRTRLTGRALFGNGLRAPATVTAESGRAMLRFRADLPAGRHPLRTRFLGRIGDTGLVLNVDGASAQVEVATAEPA